MAYDEELAHRVRELLADERGVEEKRMFGGLAFLVGGNMAIAASGQGGVLKRQLERWVKLGARYARSLPEKTLPEKTAAKREPSVGRARRTADPDAKMAT